MKIEFPSYFTKITHNLGEIPFISVLPTNLSLPERPFGILHLTIDSCEIFTFDPGTYVVICYSQMSDRVYRETVKIS